MPFKLHLGPAEPDNDGALWVDLIAQGRDNTIHLRFLGHGNTHGIRIRNDGDSLNFQISGFTDVTELPVDGRGSILCRGSNGPWSFGESTPEIPRDQVQALQNHLKGALCLH